jgi:DMSO/TMAO reductase YedYZ molybdopterin-dependent catalytic subunit
MNDLKIKKRIINDKMRVPPGQRIVPNWPLLDLGNRPEISIRKWQLELLGELENPMTLDHKTITMLPQAEITADWHCVTTWSMPDNRWQGVLLKHILALVKPSSKAKFLYLEGYDGYSTNFPIELAKLDDSLLVYGRNDEPLEVKHGAPYRIIISQRYAWKSIKWIKRIHFLERERLGYWELKGYHNNGDWKKEERYE